MRGGAVEPKKRVHLPESIRAVFKAGNARGRGVVRDISVGGLFVRSSLLPPDGESIRVHLITGSGFSFDVQGVVVWNTRDARHHPETSGFGVRLTSHSDAFSGFVDGAFCASGLDPDDDPTGGL